MREAGPCVTCTAAGVERGMHCSDSVEPIHNVSTLKTLHQATRDNTVRSLQTTFTSTACCLYSFAFLWVFAISSLGLGARMPDFCHMWTAISKNHYFISALRSSPTSHWEESKIWLGYIFFIYILNIILTFSITFPTSTFIKPSPSQLAACLLNKMKQIQKLYKHQ